MSPNTYIVKAHFKILRPAPISRIAQAYP